VANKKTTLWATSSKKPVKDHALTDLKAQIAQRTQEATQATLEAAGGGDSPTPTGVIINDQAEAPIYYTVDGIELTDDQGNRWGEFINGVPVGDASFEAPIQINAILPRVDDSTFQLPSDAAYVMEVWFDGLEAEPTNHYTFLPTVTILTVTPMPSDIIVNALYLSAVESL